MLPEGGRRLGLRERCALEERRVPGLPHGTGNRMLPFDEGPVRHDLGIPMDLV